MLGGGRLGTVAVLLMFAPVAAKLVAFGRLSAILETAPLGS